MSTRPEGTEKSSLRAAYTFAAGAAAAAAGTAQAEVVYSGVQDLSIAQFSSLGLDIDLDGFADLTLKNYVFGGGNYQGATVIYAPGQLVGFNAGPSGYAYVTALSEGFVIDASSVGPTFFGSMAYGGSNPNAQFNMVDNAYLGLSFARGGGLNYAWVRVSIDNAAGTFVVHDWAFDDAGAGIAAGVIPAPPVLGMLAAGAAGLGLMRGRQRKA
ncbi:MAG: hypothetical protein ACO3Y3_05645 [Phycisphaerales bacterium]